MALSKSAISSRQLMTSTLVTKRWKVTATAPGAEEEWNAAKPYDQIPGARSLPILGTMWAAIGAWNLYLFIKSHFYIISTLKSALIISLNMRTIATTTIRFRSGCHAPASVARHQLQKIRSYLAWQVSRTTSNGGPYTSRGYWKVAYFAANDIVVDKQYWFDGFTQIVPLRGQVPWKARIRDVDIIPTEARWAFHIEWNSKWEWRRLVPRSIQNCMQNTEIILNCLGGEFDPRHSSPSSRRPISNITFLLWVTLQKSLWRESDSSDKIITKWDPILSTKCTNGLSNASLVNL